jgi:transposase
MQLDACTAADQLAERAQDAFLQHFDAEILLSFPGLGMQLAARVLAEIGDDRTRFADARGLKAYAGSSLITRASGKKSSVIRRWIKNDRLNHAGYLWAFAAPKGSPEGQGPLPSTPRRTRRLERRCPPKLFNRMLGQLYH